jgi:hypothetical protein
MVKYNAFIKQIGRGFVVKSKFKPKSWPATFLTLAFIVFILWGTGLPMTVRAWLEPHEDVMTHVKDPQFRAAIWQHFGLPNGSPISAVTAARLERLDLSGWGSGWGITDLSGIEHFWNLKELNISNNPIGEFILHPNLEYLHTLTISNNPWLRTLKIENAERFEILNYPTVLFLIPPLETLYITGTSIEHDINLLNYGLLKHVNISNNESLPWLDVGFSLNLTYLNASNNPSLKNLLANNTALETINFANTGELVLLNINNSPIIELNLNNNPDLEFLYAHNTHLTNLHILASANPNLNHLLLCCNQYLTTLRADNLNLDLEQLFIRNNPRLETLSISGNAFTSVTEGNLTGNISLIDLNVSNNANLEYISLNHRPKLTTVNASNNPALENIYIYNTGMQNLNIINTGSLKELYVFNNELHSLNTATSPGLVYLSASYNNLTTLNVSANTLLEELYVYNNRLTSLITSNLHLWFIYAGKNRLTQLNVSNNPNLEILLVAENRLSSLNVSANQQLVHLSAEQNLLTSLNVDIPDSILTYLNVAFNALRLPVDDWNLPPSLFLPHSYFQYIPQLHGGTEPIIGIANPPPGMIGEPYPTYHLITDPVWGWPLTWRVSSGALPPGLSLCPFDGVIFGTPTVMGTYEFSVSTGTAVPGLSVNSAPQTMTITIWPAYTFDFDPWVIYYIDNNDLTHTVDVLGASSFPIILWNCCELPDYLSWEQKGNTIEITAQRPAPGQEPITDTWVLLTFMRGGALRELWIYISNLTPYPYTETVVIDFPPYFDFAIDPNDITFNNNNRVIQLNRQPVAVSLFFSATIEGTAYPPDEIPHELTWSVSGGTKPLTRINQQGVLTIAHDEDAPVLVVRAASVHNPLVYDTVVIELFIPATEIILTNNAGRVGTVFNLAANTAFVPINPVPSTAEIQWTHIGGTAAGIVVTQGGQVTVVGEGTVIVQGILRARYNQGREIVSPHFTLTFTEGDVTAVLMGFEELYVGIPVNGEVRFTLENAVFVQEIFANDFRITGLPAGLLAGTPRRVNNTTVVVPITGTPARANENDTPITLPLTLPARNILNAIQPVPVSPDPDPLRIPPVLASAVLHQQRAVFDLNPANPLQHRDIPIQMNTHNHSLRFILYGNYRMLPGTDYTVMGNDGFRIHTSFLERLPVGEWPLTFDMRMGASPEFTLVIVDTRIPPRQEPLPGPALDTHLLNPPPSDDMLIYINGTIPVRLSSLGLESGWGIIRPVLQGGRASFWIRADVLEFMAWQHPQAVIEAQTRAGTLRFPTNLLDLLRGAKAEIAAQRLEYHQVYVRITLTDRSLDTLLTNRVQRSYPGGQILAPLVEIQIELIRRSDMSVFFTVREFTRPLEWVQSIMPQTGIVRYGAFWFNDAAFSLDFAPHRVRGPNEVVIRSIYTGVHGIVNNGAVLNDVPMTSWGFNAAYTAAQKGLVQPPGGTLNPQAEITRGEFVQLLSQTLQLPSPGFIPVSYGDVPSNHPAHDAVLRALYAGLLDGESTFRPNEPILRQDMIAMTAAAITRGSPVIAPQHRPLANHFTDHHSIATRHVLAVQIALNHGIFIGLPDNTLRPTIPATRLEAVSVAVALAKVMGNID